MTVCYGFDRDILFAKRAVMLVVNAVSGNVLLRENGIDLDPGNLFGCAESGAYANRSAAVIFHAFNGAFHCFAACDAGDRSAGEMTLFGISMPI